MIKFFVIINILISLFCHVSGWNIPKSIKISDSNYTVLFDLIYTDNVLILLGSGTCNYCKMLEPVWTALSLYSIDYNNRTWREQYPEVKKSFKRNISIVHIDVSNNHQLGYLFDIQQVPRIYYFANGNFYTYNPNWPRTFDDISNFIITGYQRRLPEIKPQGPIKYRIHLNVLYELYYWTRDIYEQGKCTKYLLLSIIMSLSLGLFIKMTSKILDRKIENTTSKID